MCAWERSVCVGKKCVCVGKKCAWERSVCVGKKCVRGKKVCAVGMMEYVTHSTGSFPGSWRAAGVPLPPACRQPSHRRGTESSQPSQDGHHGTLRYREAKQGRGREGQINKTRRDGRGKRIR